MNTSHNKRLYTSRKHAIFQRVSLRALKDKTSSTSLISSRSDCRRLSAAVTLRMAARMLLTCLLLACTSVAAIDVMRYASVQYSTLYYEFVDSQGTFYPSYGDPLTVDWKSTTATSGWTSGFFPGVLWNIVQYNASRVAVQRAIDVTTPTAPFANITSTHDVGFVIMSGFGNAYRLMKLQEYLDVIVAGARSLATRYSPVVRCTRSWNSAQGFLVIIDNMMNLELLFEASNQTKDQTLYNIAWQHANRTMHEHFREDNSTYHIVEYNETDGSVIRKYTGQGRVRMALTKMSSGTCLSPRRLRRLVDVGTRAILVCAWIYYRLPLHQVPTISRQGDRCGELRPCPSAKQYRPDSILGLRCTAELHSAVPTSRYVCSSYLRQCAGRTVWIRANA